MTKSVNRRYKVIAVALCITLVASLLPRNVWGVNAAYAYTATLIPDRPTGIPKDVSEVAMMALQDAPLPTDLADLPEQWTTVEGDVSEPFVAAHSPQLQEASLNPLSISRIQSAYYPEEAINNTVIVTYTITNNQLPANLPQVAEGATLTDTVAALEQFEAERANDPNVIRNVLLVDSLTTHGAFSSATPSPDEKNGEYAWNLGDIPPLSTVTATLVLTAPTSISSTINLDNGAAAYGTYLGQMVNATACTISLSPTTLSDGTPVADYLQPTLDADRYDSYVVNKAGTYCSPEAAFTYVRGLQYEVYKGSLRGARGTEWSQAGNSLDLSNLLVAILRSNGVPTRYQHGTLDTASAQSLILSMFPTTGPVVGYVPEGAEVSDPANDSELLAEAQDHWWVEAYIDGSWVAMDPSFPQAVVGQTFTTPLGEPMAEVPDAMHHKVTVVVETEHYESITYLMDGFIYSEPLTYTFTTAELVGNPITFKQLVNTQRPPFFPTSCAVFCWTHNNYVPYLRVGDSETLIVGHQYWELLSNFPFGQRVATAAWLHFDVQDVDGNVQRFTRELGDRIGASERQGNRKIRGLIPGLLTAEVLERFNAEAPALSHELDSYSISFDPAWMSVEYAATAGDNLMAAAPRVLEIQAVGSDLEKALAGETQDISGQLILDEAADVVEDSTQAFNRMMGATYVTLADGSAQDLGETGLLRAYPDAPRITIASLTIEPTETISGTELVPVQILDLQYDHLRGIAYPGQAKNAEQVYQMTRGMNDTFLEKQVLEMLNDQPVKSAAGILQSATAQNIPLVYVDGDNLQPLKNATISDEARGRIWRATQQGYGILVPSQMVSFNGEETIAWWQIDLETGETIGVGEDGTHFSQLVTFAVGFLAFVALVVGLILLIQYIAWLNAVDLTWNYFWEAAASKRQNPGGNTKPLHEIYEEIWTGDGTTVGLKEYLQSLPTSCKLAKQSCPTPPW